MDVNINFREEVPDMIKDFGLPLLIQRTSNIFPCQCTYQRKEQLFGNAERLCTLCNNTGKVIKLEKHNGVRCEHNPDEGTSGLTSIGLIDAHLNDFYFEHDVQLQDNDIIYEIGWKDISRTKGKEELIPITLSNIYRVKISLPTRGSGGRIEYVLVLAQKENQNLVAAQQRFIRNFKYYNRNFFMRGDLI